MCLLRLKKWRVNITNIRGVSLYILFCSIKCIDNSFELKKSSHCEVERRCIANLTIVYEKNLHYNRSVVFAFRVFFF